jgi:hypothetical protein
MTRRLLWSTPWRPERTIAFAAIGTRHVTGLVGAHNLPGLTGATADGSTWQVSDGILQVTPPPQEDARQVSVLSASIRRINGPSGLGRAIRVPAAAPGSPAFPVHSRDR